MKITKKITKIMAVLMVFPVLLTACSSGPKDVAASVNGVDLPMEDYEKEYKMLATYQAQQNGKEFLEEPAFDDPNKTMGQALREIVLDNQVQREIMRQDAKDKGIEITEEDVNAKIEEAKEILGGEEEFNKILKEQNIDLDFYKKLLSYELLKEPYSAKLMEELEPSAEEVKKYYEDNKDKFEKIDASHILVETEEEAKKIKAELDGGKDFAELANKNSKDPGNQDNGGELGEFPRGAMVPEFEEAAFKLKEGEISDPVKTDFGYHIIKVNKIINNFEGQEDAVKDDLLHTRYVDYMDNLEKKAKIKKYVDPKDDIAIDLPEEDTKANAAEDKGNNQAAEENNAAKDNKAEVKENTNNKKDE